MRSTILVRLLSGFLLVQLVACASQPSRVETTHYPGAVWEPLPATERDAACQRELDASRAYLQTLDTTALLAVQNGRVLFSYGPVEKTSIVFSVRKSLLAMLYGNYVANGTVDLDQTLAQLGIDDVGGLLPIERQARLRDLLTARSGVYHVATNDGDDLAYAPARGSQQPGSYFLYNNWDFNAAGSVFERLSGRSIYQAFADDLAKPLQLEDFELARHRRTGDIAKSVHQAYHFYLSTRDMARLGYLMLEDGNWRGQQLIPAAWVKTISSVVTPSAQMHPPHTARRHFGYGYLWWTLEEGADSPLYGAYMAWGVHGQYILVIPRQHMVIAHKRLVPVAGNWDVSWVKPGDFLRVAKMLATAPCH